GGGSFSVGVRTTGVRRRLSARKIIAVRRTGSRPRRASEGLPIASHVRVGHRARTCIEESVSCVQGGVAMKKIVLAFVAGDSVASAATALAVTGSQTLQFRPGDSAWLPESYDRTTCQAVAKRGEPTFSCFVGTEYRGRYGVELSDREAVVTEYLGPGQSK